MKIAILTSSRADFGIYLPLLKALKEDSFFELDIIAFGTHLSPFHGHTINQINEQGFTVKYTIESMLASDSEESIATAMSLTMMKFSSFWQQHQGEFDLVFCLGDRYEMFAAVMAAVPFQIKFVHLHGGEKTLGAIDNVFRHAISHAASVHLTSTDQYKKRLEVMLDGTDQIYSIGALSLDNLRTIPVLSISEFAKKWKIDLNEPTVLTTFHPETVYPTLNIKYAEQLAEIMLENEKYQFLVTLPNADTSGNSIRKVFERLLVNHNRIFLIENLGTQSYFTAMKHCYFLLGNTSSGIIEAATFGKYVINLGNRQEGRACGSNVIHTEISKEAIARSIAQVEQNNVFSGENIYFQARGAENVIGILKGL